MGTKNELMKMIISGWVSSWGWRRRGCSAVRRCPGIQRQKPTSPCPGSLTVTHILKKYSKTKFRSQSKYLLLCSKILEFCDSEYTNRDFQITIPAQPGNVNSQARALTVQVPAHALQKESPTSGILQVWSLAQLLLCLLFHN